MIEKIQNLIPNSIFIQLNETIVKFNIITPLRLAHFLSQCSHESANFTVFKENLNYSASGLLKTFGKYFTAEQANLYAHKPEKIANRVYANRMGNGNEASGDGYMYCGRGAIQTTGKDNYKSFDRLVSEDIMSQPALIGTKYQLMSAAFFFETNKLWTICDEGPNAILKLTKRINGGTNGLEDRIRLFNKFYEKLK